MTSYATLFTTESTSAAGAMIDHVREPLLLYLDINPETGATKLNSPHVEVWEMAETPTLDLGYGSAVTLEEVSVILKLTRERIRQIEVRGRHLSVMLTGPGTSRSATLPAELVTRSQQAAGTATAASSLIPAGPAIAELRRFTGFTWDQLARLFGVSRRALHFWASGKAMTPSNEEHLARLQAVVRKIDRGSAQENRSALLTARADGTIPFDLLVDGQYEKVFALLGPGGARRLPHRNISEEAMAARAPRPPGDLVDALQDRVHREIGIGRAAKSVKVRGGG